MSCPGRWWSGSGLRWWSSRNNLANALDNLGEHQQAADLHRQPFTDSERILGGNHPGTLTSRGSRSHPPAMGH
ncbi:tetratricopeptide repeat protein [Streptomyces sp. NPDC088719]|uniref:tetratricopeptide repeat protein n=1 Tax=Streptomyces sp. NPDC088719 TaxID=3365872 RepID=UPI0037FD3A9C